MRSALIYAFQWFRHLGNAMEMDLENARTSYVQVINFPFKLFAATTVRLSPEYNNKWIWWRYRKCSHLQAQFDDIEVKSLRNRRESIVSMLKAKTSKFDFLCATIRLCDNFDWYFSRINWILKLEIVLRQSTLYNVF